MSKRSRSSRPAQSKASPKSRKDQGRRASSSRSRRGSSRKWIIGGLAIVAVIIVAAFVLTQTDLLDPNGGDYVVGSTQNCAGNSAFVQAVGFGTRSALDTRAKYVDGIALREIDENGNIARTYQHP